jgi:hypothetical protein
MEKSYSHREWAFPDAASGENDTSKSW